MKDKLIFEYTQMILLQESNPSYKTALKGRLFSEEGSYLSWNARCMLFVLALTPP